MFEELIFAALCLVIVLLVVDISLRFRARRARPEQKGEPLLAEPVTPPSVQSNWVQESAPRDESSKSEEAAEVVEPTFSDVDLLHEAQLYLEYGRPAQAITILRWCLDLDPDNPRYLGPLLQAYAVLADWASYTNLLTEQLQRFPPDLERISWVAEMVQAALVRVPDHPELQALWQKLQGERDASVRSATVTSSTPVQSLPPEGAGRAKAALRVARAAVEQNPLSLSLYMDWLRIAHRAEDVESYVDALLLMTLVLGDSDAPLLERMRQTGMQLGAHPAWEQLAEAQSDRQQLRALAEERKLRLPPELDRLIPPR